MKLPIVSIKLIKSTVYDITAYMIDTDKKLYTTQMPVKNISKRFCFCKNKHNVL